MARTKSPFLAEQPTAFSDSVLAYSTTQIWREFPVDGQSDLWTIPPQSMALSKSIPSAFCTQVIAAMQNSDIPAAEHALEASATDRPLSRSSVAPICLGAACSTGMITHRKGLRRPSVHRPR